ncbi:DNA primase family protein [Ligilactobacillus salivarius]|uniref:DNA primase family protein n=1 Tax=Ligilactobacillus salivarius TaxID=1624 RepID=UPI000BAF57D4|nr:DNA primase family protein [Ligilactobacillus salivarius]PAY49818.1 DNA primase [Ligilactobacillus salivarius]
MTSNNIDDLLDKATKQQEKQKQKPVTMNQLFSILKEQGQNWRDEHVKVLKNGEEKIQHIPPRTIADILKRYVIFAVIGKKEKDFEKANLAYYDLDDGIYKYNVTNIQKLIIAVERSTSIKQRRETMEYLRLEAQRKRPSDDSNLIIVGNGVFNKNTKKLEPYNPRYIFTSKISTNYNPQAQEPNFKGWSLSEWFKDIAENDKDKETLLWQSLACSINPNLTPDVAIFLVDNGQGRTGKSTFERLLENLVGIDNHAPLKLKEFEEDFKLANAQGVKLIIGDDNNPNDYNKTSENFKRVATGETVLINPKGQPPFSTQFNCFIVQSMNGLPRFKDDSDALLRRIKIIKFNHQYNDKTANKDIKEKYIKDKRLLEWILSKVIVMDFDFMTDTEESRQEIKELKIANDPVAYYVNEYIDDIKSARVPTMYHFKLFQATSDYENNPQKMKQSTFTRRLKPLLDAKGYTYSKNNLAPLTYWNVDDEKLLEKYDINYKYRFKVDIQKKQPLFEKPQDDQNKSN